MKELILFVEDQPGLDPCQFKYEMNISNTKNAKNAKNTYEE